MNFKGSWDEYLPLIEFAYNNSYHSTIEWHPSKIYMVRSVALQFAKVDEAKLLDPELVQLTSENVKLIRENENRSKPTESYANNRRRELEFEKGDLVFVKVSPSKGIMTFGRKGKSSPWYIGAFEFLDSWVLLLLIGLQYRQICPRFTMYFIYQCFGSMNQTLHMSWIKTRSE